MAIEYYVQFNGQNMGPLSEADLNRWVQAGQANADTPVWWDGQSAWQPLGKVFQVVPPGEIPVKDEYFVRVNGQKLGPLGEKDLQRWLDAGQADANTPIWSENMPEWRPLGTVFPKLAPPAAASRKLSADLVYYVQLNGQQLGPISEQDLQHWLKEGQADANLPVWRDGMAKWRPLGEVLPELF